MLRHHELVRPRDRANPVSPRAHSGFTLLEMVISVSLVSMLMVAMVDSFQGFGKQLDVLRETEKELRVEEGLVQLTHDLRNAWTVEQPDADSLVVADAYGRVTKYWVEGEALKVRRPNGAEGVLVGDIDTLSVSTKTVPRLRPDTPKQLAGPWWNQDALGAADQMVTVEEDMPVALGFTVDADAPDDMDVIEGIEEQVMQVGLQKLTLVAAFAAPVETYDDDGGGGDDGGDDSSCTDCLAACAAANAKKKPWKQKNCVVECATECAPGSGGGSDGGKDKDQDKDKGKDKDKDEGCKDGKSCKGGSGCKDKSGCGSKGGSSKGGGFGGDKDCNFVGASFGDSFGGVDASAFGGFGGFGGGKDDGCSDDDKGGKGKDKGKDDKDKGGCKPKGSSSDKVTICHKSKCKKGGGVTINVSSSAKAAHLAHGDTLGSCDGGGGGTPVPVPSPVESDLVIELFEARAPNSGVPYGPVLGSVTIPVTSLPAGTYSWTEVVNTKKPTKGDSKGCSKGGKKTVICHVPPGNPGNAHTLSVGNSAVAAHLAHGDSLGSCGIAETGDDAPVIVFDQPATELEIDLSAMNALIQPGRAHTLVMRIEGSGTLLLASDPTADPVYSGVAQVEQEADSYAAVAHSVARTLGGTMDVSQTQSVDVISGVTIKMNTKSGEKLSRSAAVLGQAAIENPWLGAVPGELPTLQLAGQ